MRSEDITIETPLGLVDEAIKRGDFTEEEFAAQWARLRRASDERRANGTKAIEPVKASEGRRRTRKAKWWSKYIVGDDGWRGYLVKCGRACWHVQEGTFTIERIR